MAGGGKHGPLTPASAFAEDAGKNSSPGKRRASPASFAFEGFRKRLNTFPQVIRHVTKVDALHELSLAKIMPDILSVFLHRKLY